MRMGLAQVTTVLDRGHWRFSRGNPFVCCLRPLNALSGALPLAARAAPALD